jgi:hypothetical protein
MWWDSDGEGKAHLRKRQCESYSASSPDLPEIFPQHKLYVRVGNLLDKLAKLLPNVSDPVTPCQAVDQPSVLALSTPQNKAIVPICRNFRLD